MIESRAERRRIERELARGVKFTPRERKGIARYKFWHPGGYRRHFLRWPVDEAALERESDVVQARAGIRQS